MDGAHLRMVKKAGERERGWGEDVSASIPTVATQDGGHGNTRAGAAPTSLSPLWVLEGLEEGQQW